MQNDTESCPYQKVRLSASPSLAPSLRGNPSWVEDGTVSQPGFLFRSSATLTNVVSTESVVVPKLQENECSAKSDPNSGTAAFGTFSGSQVSPNGTKSLPDAPSKAQAMKAQKATNDPKENVEETADRSMAHISFDEQRAAIHVMQLYRWCAVVTLILLVQVVIDASRHQFRHLPAPSELCAVFSFLYPLLSVLTMYFVPGARLYASCLLGIGTLLSTCQLAWHWVCTSVLAPPDMPLSCEAN